MAEAERGAWAGQLLRQPLDGCVVLAGLAEDVAALDFFGIPLRSASGEVEERIFAILARHDGDTMLADRGLAAEPRKSDRTDAKEPRQI
ncbi:hypothetical protein [Paracoccus versutus]|uniref:hypothetical protein n=1 Tax=Paracoccus versutus TaxID=34007 RepID=UPI000DF7311D|nr:hypothetical protein [Paracoccus versutus]RDD70424.1 hypothetical protein DVR11_16575 [Paracoccus versutus]